MTKLESIIATKIGQASMCWEHPEKAGIFDSTQATVIAKDLHDEIISEIRGFLSEDVGMYFHTLSGQKVSTQDIFDKFINK